MRPLFVMEVPPVCDARSHSLHLSVSTLTLPTAVSGDGIGGASAGADQLPASQSPPASLPVLHMVAAGNTRPRMVVRSAEPSGLVLFPPARWHQSSAGDVLVKACEETAQQCLPTTSRGYSVSSLRRGGRCVCKGQGGQWVVCTYRVSVGMHFPACVHACVHSREEA